MSNGSWTAFLSWAILASLVRRATFSVISHRLTLMTLVSSLFLVPSLEIRPPSVYEMERGTPTRRVQASNDSPCSLPFRFYFDSVFNVELRAQYSYLGSTPMLMVFGVGITALKFKEGAPVESEVIKQEAYRNRRRGNL